MTFLGPTVRSFLHRVVRIAVPGIFSINCHIFWEIGKLFVCGKGNKNSGCLAGRFFEPGSAAERRSL